MITEDIARHVGGEVMAIVSVRLGDHATIGRATGACYDAGKDVIRLYVSGSQWTDTVKAAQPGQRIAATFTQPDNYKSFQIKGHITTVEPATPADQQAAHDYVERVLGVMMRLGVTRQQLSQTFSLDALFVIAYRPFEIFDQTPGPRAGERLDGAHA